MEHYSVKGKGNVKGVAHMLLIGGMIAGKENWIERKRTRILFPGLPLKHYTTAVYSVVLLSQLCLWVKFCSGPGRGVSGEGGHNG